MPLCCSPRSPPGAAYSQQVDYQRAEQFLTWNALPLIYGDHITPAWLNDGNRFWYRVNTPRGAEFMLVDPVKAARGLLFNNARLAAALSLASDSSWDGRRLPFTTFRFGANEQQIEFSAAGNAFSCDIAQYICTKVSTSPDGVGFIRSPDGTREAFVRAHNLYVRRVGGGDESQLTTDGVPVYSWGIGHPNPSLVRSRATPRPTLQWSPDSKRIAIARHDSRGVELMPYVSMTPSRPRLYQWPYALPGDSVASSVEIHIIDVNTKVSVRVEAPPQTTTSAFGTGAGGDQAWSSVRWSDTSDRLYFLRNDRGSKAFMLFVANASTGASTLLAKDSSSTFVEMNLGGGAPNWKVIKQGAEFIWFSAATSARRILIVDDNRDTAQSLAVLFEWFGNETQVAHDGLDAVEAALVFRPDVILLDIGLPGISGYEACRRIRASVSGEGTAIIALTGLGEAGNRQRALDAGFDDHVVKPVVYADLDRILIRVMATKPLNARGDNSAS